MKFGHLIFPALFFIILIAGAFWILRTVDEVSYAGPNQPVYLESTNRQEVTPESVGTSREKAHQAFNRFAIDLVEIDVLSIEERDNLEQLLLLGEAHWGEENWAPSFYAFERVINGLGPLIDDGGLGSEKAYEIEARYSEVSESITHEIVLVEGTYLEAIEIANFGYNALEDKDWISAIQSFAKAVDILNLVKAQAAEIVDIKLQDAHFLFQSGDTAAALELYDEVLAAYPDSIDANRGLDLIQSELAKTELVEALEDEIVVVTSQEYTQVKPSLTIPEDTLNDLDDSENPIISRADQHYTKREFKESLSLYIEAYSKDPNAPGLKERISRTRNALRGEETIRLLDKAKILSELGQWTGVIKTYRQILNVDPVHQEARRGWEDALTSLVKQMEINQYKELLRHHLNASQFSHAKDVLAEAKKIFQDRENFDESFFILEQNLKNQQVPVKILLISDGETWVSIPGKLAPEQFEEKEITIFPGHLTLVGWRKGYEHHSVSTAFDFAKAPDSITVICDAPLAEQRDYVNYDGHDRVLAALGSFDLIDLLSNVESFSNWFRFGGKMDGILVEEAQIKGWELTLLTSP
ncbi:MAG: hypothetical protein O3C43_16350 [Verrucomicrobia bacterium]|nr:hypothetical protein [Verrucomicrobiota bacterium]MDA1068062.1 hypothetical protein [Verrucomicrobiota bacterium]